MKCRYYLSTMKDTGIARKIDELGRIVLPAELRKSFGIKEGDQLEISVDEDTIVLKMRQQLCVFCRSAHDLKEFNARMVCATCISDLTGSSAADTAPGDWDPFANV